jgi:hypothetical protein
MNPNERRSKTWNKIRDLTNNWDLPWVVLGDFNEIMLSHEKEGAILVHNHTCMPSVMY